jgi:putative transposase
MHGIVALVKPSSIPLRAVVRTFKGATTYRIRAEDKPDFAWQRNYFEHVIRNDEDLDRIRQYIVNNPASWAEDRFFTEAR